MTNLNAFDTGAFSTLCASLHFPAGQAASLANRVEMYSRSVNLVGVDERNILEAAERLEQAAASLRETVATMKPAAKPYLVAAE